MDSDKTLAETIAQAGFEYAHRDDLTYERGKREAFDEAIEIVRECGKQWGSEPGLASRVMKGCAELITAKLAKARGE